MRPWIRKLRFVIDLEKSRISASVVQELTHQKRSLMLQGAFDHENRFFTLPKPEHLNSQKSILAHATRRKIMR